MARGISKVCQCCYGFASHVYSIAAARVSGFPALTPFSGGVLGRYIAMALLLGLRVCDWIKIALPLVK
jgi:hypothetical protein